MVAPAITGDASGVARTITLLHDYLRESARRMPGKVALVAGRERVTYGVLDRRSDALANALITRGVERGDRVVIFGGNGVQTAIAFWGVLKANAVVSIVNPASRAGTLAYCLADLEATALIADAACAVPALADAARSEHLRAIMLWGRNGATAERWDDAVDFEQAIAAQDPAQPPPRRSLDIDLAAIIYTSGSTGEPKGVMLTHRNMVAAATSILSYLETNEDDVLLCALPLAFDYGLYQMIMAFAVGARLVLEPSFALVPKVVARMSREGVTVLPLLPTVCSLLAEMKSLEEYDLGSVRCITVSGAVFTATQIAFLERSFPQARIFSMFGLTECKRCTYLPPEDLARKPTSVGIAIPNTELWLVDDHGREVGPHAVGELVIRGATVMQGYWRDPELTAQRLKPGPLPGERVLHTGDLCTRDEDGYLYFVARADDVIKSRGVKVAPRVVEAALCALSEVKEAAVIGVPHHVFGHAVKAFVVLNGGATVSAADIARACSRTLEPAAVPTSVVFLDALPKGATGKIDRTALS